MHPSHPQSTELVKPGILLIDDSVEEQRHLLDMLHPYYRLTVAFDGQQGYQRAQVWRPDLILLDVNMPKMDGLTACRLLKADQQTRGIPVIFLSAQNTPQERVAGLALGAVDFVSKPFAAEEVLARIRIHLHLVQSHTRVQTLDESAGTPDEVALAAAKRLIEQQIDAPLCLADLARKVGRQEKKLSQIFREHTGMTIFAFIREERLRRAGQLLTQTDLSVQDIAAQLGFQNPANFATAFRERMGTTPREYRQAIRSSGQTS